MSDESSESDSERFRDDEEEGNENESSDLRKASGSSSNKDEQKLNLAGFLFGNIDHDGKLDSANNFLDPESEAKLSGLSRLLGNETGKLILGDDDSPMNDGNAGADEEFDDSAKDPTAEDFSGIKEALSDDSSSSESSENDEEEEKGKEKTVFDDKTPIKTDHEIKQEVETEESANSEPTTKDNQLMPPPSSVPAPKVKSETPHPSKLVRPLASMMPDKYKGIDVRELFPEFRPNSVLRFSRLFPIKPSLKPRIWKHVKKRAKAADLKEVQEAEKEKDDWSFNYAEWPEDPEAYEEDGVVKFHQPKEVETPKTEEGDKESDKKVPKPTDWRWGPAQYWYDMLGMAEVVSDYDYGLKTALDHMNDEISNREKRGKDFEKENLKPKGQSEDTSSKIDIPPDAFLMVTQMNWEDEVIWNGDDIRHKVMQRLHSKNNAAGWVPTGVNRTAGSFSHPGKVQPLPGSGFKLQTLQHKKPENGDDTFYSIFPVENEDLAYGRWEDEVIWDPENMPIKLKPKMVSLDPNDDNIILGIPDDIDPSTLPSDQPVRKVKVIQKHVKKSRMLLNRSGIISVIEEESPPPPPKMDDKDPYNISNDEYYVPKTQESLIKVATGGTVLQHATPTVELQTPFVPTYLGPVKLRQFHRWPLKRYSHGFLADYTKYHPIHPLMKHMKKKAKAREAEREAAGGGEIFFMRTPDDVSGKDGELVLFEYIEEHPPLFSLVGMASKIKNYYKPLPGNDKPPKNQHKYGEVTVAHTSPFLGQMAPGQLIQAFENNLYRSPIFEHKFPSTDFVVIRTRNELSIREADSMYVTAQECPLYEVPGPNSKRANNFTRDFLQVFIYRLFWKSQNNPRRIKMDDIKKAFPSHSESSIRKRLKPCAAFMRTGPHSNFWVLKPNFRLPTEEEMRAMVTPEQCCAYFSMIAAEQRLRDAGYGEKFLVAQPDEDDEESAMKMEDEVKVAPWNTTRAYIQAMKGKCLLQLTGPADPTGPAKEGFSYVRIPNKPTNKEDQEQQPKRTVTGTDADLRKLPLKDARDILRKNGVPEEAIMKLTRWEVIDVVRTLSTEKVKAGEEGDLRFSRGNRFSIAEHQERYRDECQRIFEVQNKVLASDEVLSSDESESSSEEDLNDEDLDEMGRNMESMLSNKKTHTQFHREREEAERRKLQKMFLGEDEDSQDQPTPSKRKKDQEDESNQGPNKVLKITRVFRSEEGKEYTRTEIVRKPLVIETYMKIRQTKDDAFIRQFASIDETAKEEMKKEKRRIQEQLRRIRRNQEREKLGLAKNPKRRSMKNNKPDLKLKCGACGEMGHMRTNKACPKFVGDELDTPTDSIQVAMSEKDEEELEKRVFEEVETEDLVNVEGTKMTLSANLLKRSEEVRKQTMLVRLPKKALKNAGKRRRAGTVEHCDYLTNKNYRPVKRRRTDPVISLASYLENLHAQLRQMDEALQFLQPVNTKKVPDYLEKVKNPMDLQTIRENIQQKKYKCRWDFLADIRQIVENSEIYNGGDDIYTKCAEKLLQVVVNKFMENEDKLMRLEKAINPLLDDDSQVRLTHVIEKILDDKIKMMQESWPFMHPVNRKTMKHYYEIIKNPMDLETISKKASKHNYHSREEFLADLELIVNNSKEFNGPESEFTMKAQKILDIAKDALAPYEDELNEMEDNIRKVQNKALEDVETESVGTSLGGADNDNTMDSSAPPRKKRARQKKEPISSEYVDVCGSEDEDEASRPETRKRAARGEGGQESTSLADDLQYSSEDEDDDLDDDDWKPVEEEDSTNLTVTVDEESSTAQHMLGMGGGFYQEIEAGGQQVQIEAPKIVYQADEKPENEEIEEEDQMVDENYDPTDFLHNLGQQQMQQQDEQQAVAEPTIVDSTGMPSVVEATIQMPPEVVNVGPGAEVVAEGPIDVINDDLDISDDSDDDKNVEETPEAKEDKDKEDSNKEEKKSDAPSGPLVPEPPPPDDDALWF